MAEIEIAVTNAGTQPLNDIAGQPEFTVTIAATNGAPVSVLGITSGVGPGQIPGLPPLNGTATADLQIPVGGTDTVLVRRVPGRHRQHGSAVDQPRHLD